MQWLQPDDEPQCFAGNLAGRMQRFSLHDWGSSILPWMMAAQALFALDELHAGEKERVDNRKIVDPGTGRETTLICRSKTSPSIALSIRFITSKQPQHYPKRGTAR